MDTMVSQRSFLEGRGLVVRIPDISFRVEPKAPKP